LYYSHTPYRYWHRYIRDCAHGNSFSQYSIIFSCKSLANENPEPVHFLNNKYKTTSEVRSSKQIHEVKDPASVHGKFHDSVKNQLFARQKTVSEIHGA